MNGYYDEAGTPLGRAWSAIKCKDAEAGEVHHPHSHNPEFASYGPYMCEGYPKILLFDTPKRKPVNP